MQRNHRNNKTLICTLGCALLLALTGCGGGGNTADDSETSPLPEATAEGSVIPESDMNVPATPEDGTQPPVDADSAVSEDSSSSGGDNAQSGTTLGQTLLQVFQTETAADSAMDLTALAEKILADPAIGFQGAAVPVEEGLLTGFNNTEITGFTEGVSFAPMIGTIPFMGYLFRLDAEADIDAFMELLETSADLRWNVCTEADELIVEVSGDTVFFLMCPTGFDE